ncbi:MAG: hypothetical protein H7Y20_06810, partial [Bryobacteraceae bacterium]|nr:hypothetical protein [Bryobacteraceae bacterium]
DFNPDIVRLRKGLLTHQLSRSSLLRFNIAGWHKDFSYGESWRVITNAEQQIRTGDNGQVTVFTTIDMNAASEKRRTRSRSEEMVQTNFLLRFLGETRGAISESTFDARDKQFAIEVITGAAASYTARFTDNQTTEPELADLLSFAKVLGLDEQGATRDQLGPYLEKAGGNLGPVTADFSVRFLAEGIDQLFRNPVNDSEIRTVLRSIVLANYIKDPGLLLIGWLYCSDEVRQVWEENPIGFISAESVLADVLRDGIKLQTPIPGLHPDRLSMPDPARRVLLNTLFQIEARLIHSFQSLANLVSGGSPVKLSEFEKRMQDFGSVLQSFDSRDAGDNTVFAVFDALIRLNAGARRIRNSSMSFTCVKEGRERLLIFVEPA